ncbi:hypothetical protein MPNT_10090 [Candidatus Methylacidithermus pantelleriae]|uniref:Uncharacterized protein n=1 Tax=Candidatus Methylacidithermus pantelleriae TaxID=2744239 RepID=A0A8J2FMJ9_9BACT|nr:hypothetical protein MPNT_10090 [Candidatus Methylacidithermus pantelleriae]
MRPNPGLAGKHSRPGKATLGPCLALHRAGFVVPRPLPERAVGSYPTFSPLPQGSPEGKP